MDLYAVVAATAPGTDLYEKVASTRWQRELGTMAPEQLINHRHQMWSQGDELTDEQLDRHRELRRRQVEQVSRNEGIKPGDSMLAQMQGAHMVGGQVQLPPDQGMKLRGILNQREAMQAMPKANWMDLLTQGGRERYARQAMGVAENIKTPVPQPEDPTIQHAVMQHELGERAQANASKNGIGARYVASHLGETPDIAERHSTFRDPAAGRTFDSLRSLDPGDEFIQKKMRQFGHTPNNPMPLGGRQHRAVAHEVLERAPLTDGARINRAMAGVWPLRQVTESVRTALTEAAGGVKPELYDVALPHSVRSGLAKAQQAASTVGRAMQKVPGGTGLYEFFRPHVKNLLTSGHAPSGSSADFLRHLSTVR